MTLILLFVISLRSKAARDKNRDISEKIALGLPNAGNVSQEALYDQRLFNSTKVSHCLKLFSRSVYFKNTGFQNLIGSLLTSDFVNKCGSSFVGKCNFIMLISTIQQTHEFFCHFFYKEGLT